MNETIMPLSDNIKIVTINCKGLASPSKRQDVLNYYKQLRYSILCKQDTFIPEIESFIESQCGYKCIFNSFLQILEVFAFYSTMI